MDDLRDKYPDNSFKARIENEQDKPAAANGKTVTKVTTGTVTKKKKSFLTSVSEVLIGNDTNSVGSYILYDILIPAAKNTITEMISSGIEMLLYGESNKSSDIRRDKSRSFVSYSRYYDRDRDRDRDRERRHDREERYRRPGRSNIDEFIFERRSDAEAVLSQMVDFIDRYDQVSIADFNDLVGVTGEYTDNQFGWENLSRATVEHIRSGWILNLPRPQPLD